MDMVQGSFWYCAVLRRIQGVRVTNETVGLMGWGPDWVHELLRL